MAVVQKKIQGYPFLFVHEPNKVLHLEAIVHSGFIHETKHTSGVNHLLEHVLISSWEKCKTTCIDYWRKRGVYVNASTDNTVMKYYIQGTKPDFAEMVHYLSSIVTHALFTTSTLDQEKKAVIGELLDLDIDDSKLDDVFHKHFYSIEGLQCAEDIPLQLKNVNALTMKEIKQSYDMFNTDNILFLVYGSYDSSIESLFHQWLKPKVGKPLPVIDCFTNHHDIIFTKYNKKTTTFVIGFPSTLQTYFLPYFKLLLHDLLFEELRTKHHYIYDVQIDCDSFRCGTVTKITINVQSKNAVLVFHSILKCLKKYQTQLISEAEVQGIQKSMLYKYQTTYSYIHYYSFFIHQKHPLSKTQLIQKRTEFTPTVFRELCRELCPLDKALCVYQNKTPLNLTF